MRNDADRGREGEHLFPLIHADERRERGGGRGCFAWHLRFRVRGGFAPVPMVAAPPSRGRGSQRRGASLGETRLREPLRLPVRLEPLVGSAAHDKRFGLRGRLRSGLDLLYLLEASTELEATRNPSWLSRSPGTLPFRSADRQNLGLPPQPPPRFTRREPAVAPVGSSTGVAVYSPYRSEHHSHTFPCMS